MAFNRIVAPPAPIDSETLTAQMVGIGMNFAAPPTPEPNIEDTIFLAGIEGVEKDDLRVLAVLVTWFGIHASWVNADRLTNLVAAETSGRVRALWSALALWQKGDRRFARLGALYTGPRQGLGAGSDYHVQRYGEDIRFNGSPVRVAANTLRDRVADVLQPSVLARQHLAYRYRIMMGPSYRPDMWAALERDPHLTAAALARKTVWLLRHGLASASGLRVHSRCFIPRFQHPIGTERASKIGISASRIDAQIGPPMRPGATACDGFRSERAARLEADREDVNSTKYLRRCSLPEMDLRSPRRIEPGL
jgi:hypothetical protein